MNDAVRLGRAARVCAAVVVSAVLLLAGCERQQPEPLGSGDRLPALSFESLTGGTMDTEDWHGRTVVLNFWATWCPPCREEMPALERLSRSLDPGRFRVVGLSLDTDRNLVREFALQHGVTFPLAIDPEGRTVKARLGLWALPDTLIVGPDGRIAERVLGAAAWASQAMRSRVLAAAGGLGEGAPSPEGGDDVAMHDRRGHNGGGGGAMP